MEVVASLSQGRTAAAQCGLFTHKSVLVIFEAPCKIREKIDKWLKMVVRTTWNTENLRMLCLLSSIFTTGFQEPYRCQRHNLN